MLVLVDQFANSLATFLMLLKEMIKYCDDIYVKRKRSRQKSLLKIHKYSSTTLESPEANSYCLCMQV